MSCESTCVLLCGSEPLKFVLFLHKIRCVFRRPANFLTFPTFCCWHVQYLGKWVSCYVSFEIPTALTVESIVFWAVTPCSLVEIYWLLWRTQFLCLNTTGSSIVLVNSTLLHSITSQNTIFLGLLLVWPITSTLWFMLLQLLLMFLKPETMFKLIWTSYFDLCMYLSFKVKWFPVHAYLNFMFGLLKNV